VRYLGNSDLEAPGPGRPGNASDTPPAARYLSKFVENDSLALAWL
jgi:hypothetical protein